MMMKTDMFAEEGKREERCHAQAHTRFTCRAATTQESNPRFIFNLSSNCQIFGCRHILHVITAVAKLCAPICSVRMCVCAFGVRQERKGPNPIPHLHFTHIRWRVVVRWRLKVFNSNGPFGINHINANDWKTTQSRAYPYSPSLLSQCENRSNERWVNKIDLSWNGLTFPCEMQMVIDCFTRAETIPNNWGAHTRLPASRLWNRFMFMFVRVVYVARQWRESR